MSAEWLFARRYLLSRKSHSVINTIAAVSLVSVAVPVAAMVILMSVFNGFESLVRSTYVAVDADVELRAQGGARPDIFVVSDANRSAVEAVEGVAAASYTLERQALLEYNGRRCAASLRGVDANYASVVPILDHVKLGEGAVCEGAGQGILLGAGTAYTLGVYSVSGNGLTIHSLGGGGVGSMLPPVMRSEQMPVCGIFSIDSDSDNGHAIISLQAAERLFATGGRADAIMVRAEGGVSAERLCERLERELGEGVGASTREQKNSAFYRIMRYEKWGIFFISVLVLVIASLSIVGAVVMLIVEKRDEQTTLHALGADRRFLRGIFVREGVLISGVGGVSGLLLGVVVVLLQQGFGLVRLPAGAFIIDAYPVELQAADLAVIFVTFAIIAWGVSAVATRAIIKR